MNPSLPPSLCYAQLPAAGLGNRLFVWARALIFAHLNGLPLGVSSWESAQLRRRLRRDPDQRRYGDFFLDPCPLGAWQKARLLRSKSRVVEPRLEAVATAERAELYLFNQMPHWSDYFAGIRDHRELVQSGLKANLSPHYREKLAKLEAPCIGVHVRMGDFPALQPGQDFAKVGQVRAPFAYFEELIQGVREIHGSPLPVTIFSDGLDAELAPLLRLPAVRRAAPESAILDLLLLARSRLIIAAPSSTFSAWSGFLADAPLLLHPDHIHAPVRPPEHFARFFEGGARGAATGWPALLRQNIESITPDGMAPEGVAPGAFLP